jgi:hypothetical protein
MRDYVVQVSDRRVMTPDGSWREDHTNKAVFFCGHSSFAYTGIASLEGLPTDEWLTLKLETAKALADGLPLLQRKAKDAIQRVRFPASVPPSKRPAIRRLAFVNVAFVLMEEPSAAGTERKPLRTDTIGKASAQDLRPLLTVVSNFFRPPNQWLGKAESDFTVVHRRLAEDEACAIFASGQRIRDEDHRRLTRDVRRCVERSTSAQQVARILAQQVQAVSKVNQAVGPNVMCSLIPRTAVLSQAGLYPESGLIPLRPEYASEAGLFRHAKDEVPKKAYIYLPGSVKSAAEQVYYGPNYVCSGLMFKGPLMGPTSLVQTTAPGAKGIPSRAPAPTRPAPSVTATTTVANADAGLKGLPGGVRPYVSINYRLSDPAATAWVFANYTADTQAAPVDLGGTEIPPEPGFVSGPGFGFFPPIGASTVTITSNVQYADGSTETVASIVDLSK